MKKYNVDFLIEVIGSMSLKGSFLKFLIKNADKDSEVNMELKKASENWKKEMLETGKEILKNTKEEKEIEEKIKKIESYSGIPGGTYFSEQKIFLRLSNRIKFSNPIFNKEGEFNQEAIIELLKKSNPAISMFLAWMLEEANKDLLVLGSSISLTENYNHWVKKDYEEEMIDLEKNKEKYADTWEKRKDIIEKNFKKYSITNQSAKMFALELKKNNLIYREEKEFRLKINPKFFA